MCYKARSSKAEAVYQTSHRSSFVTVARFSMALDSGLEMPDEEEVGNLFFDLPKVSLQPIEVLTLARVHGIVWHKGLCIDAAYYGNFELLKWLLKSGCPWDLMDVAINAVRSTEGQHELILPWLLRTVAVWSPEDKTKLVFEAGVMCSIAALKLMLQQGAEWPSSFIGEQEVSGVHVRTSWHYRAVACALEKGCSWGEWRCQDLAPDLHAVEDGYRADAKSLFKWAHQNGCPCTCEAATANGAVVAA
jgi:hypothetical protein